MAPHRRTLIRQAVVERLASAGTLTRHRAAPHDRPQKACSAACGGPGGRRPGCVPQTALWNLTSTLDLDDRTLDDLDDALIVSKLDRNQITSVLLPWVQPVPDDPNLPGYPTNATCSHLDKIWINKLPQPNFYEPGTQNSRWQEYLDVGIPDWDINQLPYDLDAKVYHEYPGRRSVYWISKTPANTTEPGADFLGQQFFDRYWGPIDKDGNPVSPSLQKRKPVKEKKNPSLTK